MQPEIQEKTQTSAARKMRGALRKQDERKISELPTREHGTATIQVARTGSMWLERPTEDRAALETKELAGISQKQAKRGARETSCK